MVVIADLICADDWISREALQRIIFKTTKVMKKRRINKKESSSFSDEVLESARQILNETVAISLQRQLMQEMDLDELGFAKSASAALKYFEVIDRFNLLGFEYPTADMELRQQLERTAKFLKIDATQSTKLPKQWWEGTFYPETLGLFSALFQEKPTASYNPDTKDQNGAALVFIGELVTEVKVSRNADSLFFAAEVYGLDLSEWQFHSNNALRNKLYFWLGEPKAKPDGEKIWQENRRFYEACLNSDDEGSPT
jgi:hypothetical protein